jgi:hypothetical protein
MIKRSPKQWLTMAETAGKLEITVEELLVLIEAGEIRYASARPGPTLPWRLDEAIDLVCFVQADINKFNEGFTISEFARRLGVDDNEVREAIDDGGVTVTVIDDGRSPRPRQRVLRGDFERTAAAFRRWQKKVENVLR